MNNDDRRVLDPRLIPPPPIPHGIAQPEVGGRMSFVDVLRALMERFKWRP